MNLAAQRPRGSPSFAIQSDLVAHENVVVVHTGCDGTDDDARFVVGSMDHLTITDIDAGMVGVNHNIAGLRIGHTGPTHEVDRGAQTAVASREAIAYKTGAVKAVRPNATPRVSVSELAKETGPPRTGDEPEREWSFNGAAAEPEPEPERASGAAEWERARACFRRRRWSYRHPCWCSRSYRRCRCSPWPFRRC